MLLFLRLGALAHHDGEMAERLDDAGRAAAAAGLETLHDEALADRRLGDVHRDELPAVVDAERQADELRQDRRAARPGLDHVAAHAAARLLGFLDQAALYEGALPNGTCHCLSPTASRDGDGR